MLGLSLGLSLGTSAIVAGPKDEVLAPAYLTGTPMDTLELTAYPGSYSFIPDGFTRQMQVSNDGLVDWADLGSPLAGTSFQITNDLVGKYLRLVETAVSDGKTLVSMSPVIGPVVAYSTLPATPFSSGEKLWALGDSQIGYNNYLGSPVGTGGNSAVLAALSTGYGFVEWAKAIDPRFSFDVWYDPADPLGRNFQGADLGIFGDHMQPTATVPGIIPRVPSLVARNPKLVLFNGGLNTVHSNDNGHLGTADYVIQQLNQGLSLLRQGNARVIFMVPYPTGMWPSGDRRYDTLAAVQAWCRAQAGRDGVILLDAGDVLAPGGVLDVTLMRSDLIHLSPKGALAVATEVFLPIVQSLYSSGTTFNTDVTVSNLMAASLVNMDGTAGSKAGVANTGNVPTAWMVTRGRNCTIVNSIDDYETGKHRLNISVTPTALDNGDYFEFMVTPPTVVIATGEPTKWYQAWFRVEIDEMKDLTFIELLYGQYIGVNTAVHRSAGLGREASADFAKGQISGPLDLWLTAPAVTNQSGSVTINGYRGFLRFSGNRVGSPLNIKISRPIIREVTDPRPVWGF